MTNLKHQSELEKALHSLTVPPPSTNLAERIIAAARPYEPQQQRSLIGALGELLFPKPAYVYACALGITLMLGVVAGWELPGSLDTSSSESTVAEDGLDSFLYDQGEIL